MATLREYFDTDFPRVLNAAQVIQVRTDAAPIEVPVRVHLDFDANAKYLSCLLPAAGCNKSVCSALVVNISQLLATADSVEVHSGLPGETPFRSTELRFAGRLFLYHESDIDVEVQDEIRARAKEHDLFVQFRGPRFAAE